LFLNSMSHGTWKGAVVGLTCAGLLFASTINASSASGKQCGPRFIAVNIKSAVLALKATEFCTGQALPYSAIDVWERIDSLRCGPESSALIDDLINDYDREYSTILATDAKQTVCNMATTIDLS